MFHFNNRVSGLLCEAYKNHKKKLYMQKIERTIYIVTILLLLIFILRSCSTVADLTNDYIDINKKYTQISVTHQKDSSKIYSMQVNLEDANRKIMGLSIIKLKNPKEIVKIVYRTKVVTEIQLSEPISVDSSLYMKLPQQFTKKDKWFSLNGNINLKGTLVIDSFNTFGIFTYGVGDTLRNGLFNRLFRKKDHVVRLHIDNPYMNVTNLENIYIREDKKWYQTRGFNILFGAIIGFGIANQVK